MKVELIAHTPDADSLCAAAARSCYSNASMGDLLSSMNEQALAKVLQDTVGMGHHSVLEHAVYTFNVEGVSRTLTHQLVRHRIASFSQQSQRYVSMAQASYVTPPKVDSNGDASQRFHSLMNEIWAAYDELATMVPKEDARYVLPNACTTNITITMNARELLHFLSLRCCNRAQWEIREMADEMLRHLRKASPVIFARAGPGCVRGACPEGRLSCGSSRREDILSW